MTENKTYQQRRPSPNPGEDFKPAVLCWSELGGVGPMMRRVGWSETVT